MAGRFIPPSEQYLTDSGDILSGGKLFFYDSGTAVLKNTFSDPDGTTANTNPVILDGAGRTPNIFLDGAYKLIIKDANDVQIEERDPVLASDSTTKGFGVWNAVTIFSLNDISRASNNLLYISIIGSNQNNEPSATATAWTQVQLLRTYNVNETYVIGNVAADSIGNVYRSLTNGNVGNTPSSSPTDWTSIVAGAFAGNVTVGGTLAVTGAATFSSTVSAAAGAYVGGTAASNLLDEYTGLLTYTPAFNNFGTGTYAVRVGRYNRVGKAVTVQLHLDVAALGNASGAVTFTLPLVASSASSYFGTAGAIHAQNWATAVEGLNVLVDSGTNRASLYYNAGKTTGAAAVTHAIMGTGNIVLTIHYFTD